MNKPESDANPVLQDFIPPREIPRRRLINAGIANQKFRRAVLEAAGEVASEFTNHYWKEVVQKKDPNAPLNDKLPPPTNSQVLKKGFIFYMNASGRYLILREHLRQSVSHMVQQRCLNLKPSGFQTHREFQSFLHDMYNYLIDDVHETLNRTIFQETDPLDPIPSPPRGICNKEGQEGVEISPTLKELGTQTLLRELLFYAEESFAQGDFDNCHRIHLQRICRSREAATCWVEFALMWLSRGDERMAEIAVREALKKAPRYIYALLIGGLIAIRHDDPRGIAVLAAALEVKPISPEMLVILGMSHAILGKEEDAEYFFRKAAFLHRTLTGQKTQGLNEMFDKVSKNVNVTESIKEITGVESLYGVKKNSLGEQQLIEALSGNYDFVSEAEPSKRPSAQEESKGRKSAVNAAFPKISTVPVQPPRSSVVEPDANNNNEVPLGQDEDFYTRKNSLSRENPPPPEIATIPQPKYDFTPYLTDLRVEDAIMPVLRPSILIPWNVTELSDKMKELVEIDVTYFLEEQARKKASAASLSTLSGAAPDTVIVAEYDELVKRPSDSHGSKAKRKSSAAARRESMSKKKSAAKRKTLEAKGQQEERKSSEVITERPISASVANHDLGENESEGDLTSSIGPTEEKEDPLPVYVKRLGSELIWTGQLLLQLRMFDMLDGVLTRELYVSGKRTIQFLYLRAMSLYMRKCQAEALPLVEEGIQLDAENPILWILRGHCYYELDNAAEAMASYESALRLPVGKENRHLLYLRFGSLALDQNNLDTAKRVFMYGIQKYPTPNLWLAVGNACYLMGDYSQAEAAFAEANRLDNTNPMTWAHLALINLASDQQALAEQSYKWALRFGLKKGKILDEIKKMQQEKGFGDPSFPRLPNCIPHDYYVRRLGRQKPFDIYRDALMHESPTLGKKRFENTERENALRDKLQAEGREAAAAKAVAEAAEEQLPNSTEGAADSLQPDRTNFPELQTDSAQENERLQVPEKKGKKNKSVVPAMTSRSRKSRRSKKPEQQQEGDAGAEEGKRKSLVEK